ncbi:hypothetical protein [Inquilinus sp. CAU 1745]|uniref:hypothetical protein n=1 Tax=Inquilinus sp. CAU 1745 TaxID=3140369 RepID=UPI00325C0D02
MRALKFLVIAMGVAIVAGFALVAYEVIRRSGEPVEPPVATAAPAGEPFASTLALPEGARIAGMAGVGDQLVVNVAMPDGTGRAFFIDPATGDVLGTLDITEAE